MRSLLFHGTRYPRRILEADTLLYGRIGTPLISFSRSRLVARRFAEMERDDDDGCGAVLIFDRDKLRTRYKIELYDYGFDTGAADEWRAEAEECIFETDVRPLSRFLASIEWVTATPPLKHDGMLSVMRAL